MVDESKHKDTGNKALLTCSRFQHLPGDPPPPELFKANAERIRSAPLVEMPKVYDFGIQDRVYWIAVQYIDAPNVAMLNQKRLNARAFNAGASGDRRNAPRYECVFARCGLCGFISIQWSSGETLFKVLRA